GIAPDDLRRLFTPFERLGAEQSTVPGTGLGLAVSKRLVEAMGGTIDVDSAPGQGSRFTIELEVTGSPVDAAGPADLAATPDGWRGTVLYIEDNLANVELVERILHRR